MPPNPSKYCSRVIAESRAAYLFPPTILEDNHLGRLWPCRFEGNRAQTDLFFLSPASLDAQPQVNQTSIKWAV